MSPSTPVEEVVDAFGEGLDDVIDRGNVGEFGAGDALGLAKPVEKGLFPRGVNAFNLVQRVIQQSLAAQSP